MITLDESTLIAYVDGELDAETVRMVEDKLCTDEHATNYVERLREIAALSRIAFNDTLHEAVPQTIRDTVLNAATVKGGDADNVVVFAPSRAHNDWGRALPMAAAVACLLLGLGGGYQYSQTSAEHALKLASMTLQQDQSSMELALNQALEVKMTGDAQTWTNPDTRRSATFTPVNTYQDQSGAFCREYRKDFNTKDQSETTFGLACRDDKGTWKTRYLILDNSNNQKF